MDNRIKELIARFKQTSPVASSVEQTDELERDLEQIWKLSGQYKQQAFPDFSSKKNLAQLKQRIQADKKTRPSKLKRIGVLRIAAAIVFLLACAWLVNLLITPSNQVQWVENNSPQNLEMVLEDGTEILLFPDARLGYTKSFKGQATRAVTLFGKAHFDVTPNPEKVFTIQTTNTKVEVLGTQFVLDHSDLQTTVTVEEGRVAFTDKSSGKMIEVAAEQVGVCQAGNILFQEPINVQNGPQLIQLRKETLARLVAQLSRRHNWNIHLDNQLQTCTITGEFDLSQPQVVFKKITALGYQVEKKAANQYQITGICEE